MARQSYKDYLSGKIQVTEENISKAVSWLSAAANKRLKRIQQQGWTYVGADSPNAQGDDVIAGHRKFGAKGKTKQQLFSEFKRLKSFFEEQASSVGGVRKQAKEFKIEAKQLFNYRLAKDTEELYRQFYDNNQYVDYGDEYEKPLSEKERKEFEQAKKAEETRSGRTGKTDNTYHSWQSEREWYEEWLLGVRIYNYLRENELYRPSIHDSDQMRNCCSFIASVYGNSNYSVEELAEKALERFNRQNGKSTSSSDNDVSTSTFINNNL